MPHHSSIISIKWIILAAIICMMGLLGATTGWHLFQWWGTYRTATEQREFDLGANRFVRGLYEVLLERLETNNALHTSGPVEASVVAKIEGFRKSAKSDFEIGLLAIEQRDFSNKSEVLRALKGALQKADGYRSRADEAIQLPRERRDHDPVENYIPVITHFVDAAIKVWYAALYSTGNESFQLQQLATIKEIGWRMREYAGLERSIIASAIATGASIPAEQLPMIAEHRTRVALLWDQLKNLTADSATHPAIKDAMRVSEQKYFNDFLSLSNQMRGVSDAGEKYPMTATQWVDTTNPQIDALLGVLYAASTASETSTDIALKNAIRNLENVGLVLIVSIAIGFACIWIVFARVTRPLLHLANSLRELADGNFSVLLPGLGRHDEIGAMAQAIETFKLTAEEKGRREVAAQVEQHRAVAARHKANMQKLGDEFEAAVGDIVITVARAAIELKTSAMMLTENAETTERLSATVAIASEGASANVKSVSAATVEMGSSADEVGRQAQNSAAIAASAVQQADQTNTRIAELLQAADQIGGVVKIITDIAEQTSLLALNATIEAARAGEAGRGFAVVAQEVKALAAQSVQATGKINGQVIGIQAATQQSVSAIKDIGSTISRLSETASIIAAAVNEQGASIQEIMVIAMQR
jgi:methyl-accepting chemotaxis protein